MAWESSQLYPLQSKYYHAFFEQHWFLVDLAGNLGWRLIDYHLSELAAELLVHVVMDKVKLVSE